MIIYLAGFKSIEKLYPDPVDDLYLLSSFWEHRTGKFGDYVYSKKHILDSGAFSAMSNPGKTRSIDWREYARSYADFIVKTKQREFFELDIDAIVGYEEVENLRDLIQQRTGRAAIPVWHKSRGIDEWHRLIESRDIVAIGGFVTKEIMPAEYKFIIPMIRGAIRNNCRVHGLGFTSTKWLRRLKFYSVDSGTWIVGKRYGNICVMKPDGTMNQKYPGRNDGMKVQDRDSLDLYNFRIWVRFQRWAETNL